MQVHSTLAHICTLVFNRSPEPKESQHHLSGWWEGRLGPSSKPTSDIFLHMEVGLPQPRLTSGCRFCSSCCYMCLTAGLSHAKEERCQGRGVPEGHTLQGTSNWLRTRFSEWAAADPIRSVPSNVSMAYVTLRRAAPREGDGVGFGVWAVVGGGWAELDVHEDREGMCVTSAPHLAANNYLNHNISTNSVTGNSYKELNLLVGSGRSMQDPVFGSVLFLSGIGGVQRHQWQRRISLWINVTYWEILFTFLITMLGAVGWSRLYANLVYFREFNPLFAAFCK